MKNLRYIILTISLFSGILFSCSFFQNNNKKVEDQIIQNKDTLSFMEIFSDIPDIKLPYILRCGIEHGFPLIEDLEKDIMKIGGENSVIVGKIPVDNDNIYILYGLTGDIIYPYLNTYNKNGHKIDSLYLHISYCGADAEIIETPTTIINKDFSIYMVDTAQYIHYNKNDESYERIIDSIIIKTRKMDLLKNGYYKLTEETMFNVEQSPPISGI